MSSSIEFAKIFENDHKSQSQGVNLEAFSCNLEVRISI